MDVTEPTYTYVAMGFTDDVTTCEICGKPELKGTVRLEIRSTDGDTDGEVYAGVTCAARRAGRKAAEIRTEATRADRARDEATRETWRAWQDAKSTFHCTMRDAALGPARTPRQVFAYYDTDDFRDAYAAWLVCNPMPPTPTYAR